VLGRLVAQLLRKCPRHRPGKNSSPMAAHPQAPMHDVQGNRLPNQSMQGGGFQRPRYLAQCAECGRRHPPYALCYGRNYERAPVQQPQVHMTPATYEGEFASNADLHEDAWAPLGSYSTMLDRVAEDS